jgi:hypothetical protein
MNTSYTRTTATEWTTTVRLGLWASLVAAFAAIALAGTMPEPVVIIGVILGSSLVSWRQIDRAAAPLTARRQPIRH